LPRCRLQLEERNLRMPKEEQHAAIGEDIGSYFFWNCNYLLPNALLLS
jgi:hypothetical protein